MAHEPNVQKLTDSIPDYDALVAQLATMRTEMTKLAASVSSAAAKNGKAMAQDMSDGMSDARSYITRKGHEADLRVEHAVVANPYVALGLAAGFGLLLGALTRR